MAILSNNIKSKKIMQKVISVNINVAPRDKDGELIKFVEHEYPELNKSLSEGYKVVQFYQTSPNNTIPYSTLTFVLEKQDPVSSF